MKSVSIDIYHLKEKGNSQRLNYIILCYKMSIKQRARGLKRKWMGYKELPGKDTPENFQEIKFT